MNRYQQIISKKNQTIFSFAYQEDLDHAYAFYCARYENVSWKEFLQLGLFEFKKKLGSLPKDEPLYEIIKSRTIDIGKIKDKEERKYWRELRRINEIPQVYLSNNEIDGRLQNAVKQNRGGML
jgi:hypothetical protein